MILLLLLLLMFLQPAALLFQGGQFRFFGTKMRTKPTGETTSTRLLNPSIGWNDSHLEPRTTLIGGISRPNVTQKGKQSIRSKHMRDVKGVCEKTVVPGTATTQAVDS